MSEWDGFFNQTVDISTIYSAAPINAYGDPSYNTAVTYSAKIDLRIKKVITVNGEEAISSAVIFLPGSIELDRFGRDKIYYNSSHPPILAIEDARDPDTGLIDHWEVSI